MEEDLELKHVCKFCSKSFSCGRSLGGHMRSHIINMNKNNNSSTDIKKYTEKKHIHSVSEKERMSLSFDDDDDDDDCHSAAAAPSKGRRSKRRCRCRCSNITTSSSVSEIDQLEQEEVAMSLMMLSRDVGNWGRLNSVAAESSDNTSELILINMKNKKKKKLDSNWMNEDASYQLSCSKRSKFECTTCNKTFHSYQALGGHRASHKKTKGCFASTSSKEDQISIDVTQQAAAGKIMNHVIGTRSHECPICLKVFSSGQALGGHKRSHLLSETGENHTVLIPKPIPGIREFLDHNMPAPLEDQEGFNPWWVGSSSHKHETLVGLI